MEFLSEDPTFLAGGLGLVAATFLIALRVTQQGKYLVWALSSLALMAAVLVVERVWVTDNEQVEQAVYGLGQAVANSDVEGVLDRLTPDVQLVIGGASTPGPVTRELIKYRISGTKFDFLRVTHLRTNAGGQSRRGTAEFRVLTGGSFEGAYNTLNFGSVNSTWSLGFRETSPRVWKVNRITPVSVPGLQYLTSPAGRPAQRAERSPLSDTYRGNPHYPRFPGFPQGNRLFPMPAGPVIPATSPALPRRPTP